MIFISSVGKGRSKSAKNFEQPELSIFQLISFHNFHRFDILDFWNVRSPTNDYLFYNQKEYLHRMTTGGYSAGDPPSDRVLCLLDYAFQQWNDQWFKRREMPKFPHLLKVVSVKKTSRLLQNAPIMIRKGWAMKVSLGRLFTTNKTAKLEDPTFFGRKADTFNLHPDELIVGRMPPCFSLGLGKAVMPYLREDETMPAFFKGLSEAAGMGHVIPDFETLLQKGLGKMIEEMKANMGETEKQKEFVRSCILALEGVQKYIKNFGYLAGYCAQKSDFALSEAQRSNLKKVRLKELKKVTTTTLLITLHIQVVFTFKAASSCSILEKFGLVSSDSSFVMRDQSFHLFSSLLLNGLLLSPWCLTILIN